MGAVDPKDDNMLKISSDGRKAALDMRMVGIFTNKPGKIDAAANRIAAIWDDHRDDVFHGPDGTEDPTRGSLQIVFCDLGTPHEGEWSVYEELRTQLVERGIPREQVRFIHEADSDQKKGELFADCRAGRVAVILGSTEKMGVGTNIQRRAIALHHLDAPWRPADIQQREGRILRWGNQHPEVEIYRDVTEGSFDAYMWQTLARKAVFINQIMRGRIDVREMDDIGDTALSFNEIKALAAGNPLLLDKAKADAELARLERLHRAWAANHDRVRAQIAAHEEHITRLADEAQAVTAAKDTRIDTRGDNFQMILQETTYTERTEAGRALQSLLGGRLMSAPNGERSVLGVIGELGGFSINAEVWHYGATRQASLSVRGIPRSEIVLESMDVLGGKSLGMITRLENRVNDLDVLEHKIRDEDAAARRELERARPALNDVFTHHDALEAARAEAARINEAIGARAKEDEETADFITPAPATDHSPNSTPPELADAEDLSATTTASHVIPPRSELASAFAFGAASHIASANTDDPDTVVAGAYTSHTQIVDARARVARATLGLHDAIQRSGAPAHGSPHVNELIRAIDLLHNHDVTDGRGPGLRELDRYQAVVRAAAAAKDNAFTSAIGQAAAALETRAATHVARLQADSDAADQLLRAALAPDVVTPPAKQTPQATPSTSTRVLTIQHTVEGTLVRNTVKGDHPVRGALRDSGFTWSRRIEAWYLRRALDYDTRTARVKAFTRGLDRIGRVYELHDAQATPMTQEASPIPEPSVEPSRAIETRAARMMFWLLNHVAEPPAEGNLTIEDFVGPLAFAEPASLTEAIQTFEIAYRATESPARSWQGGDPVHHTRDALGKEWSALDEDKTFAAAGDRMRIMAHLARRMADDSISSPEAVYTLRAFAEEADRFSTRMHATSRVLACAAAREPAHPVAEQQAVHEEVLLACMMRDPHRVDVYASLVAESDFTDPSRGQLYRALVVLHEHERPLDIATLAAEPTIAESVPLDGLARLAARNLSLDRDYVDGMPQARAIVEASIDRRRASAGVATTPPEQRTTTRPPQTAPTAPPAMPQPRPAHQILRPG